ncbi:hypothetical protein WMY93_029175 [Mugilogobius chulae]|uniref:Neurogenic mastermind-like N-terminal domain-containing protein n=1 Tax=Mugilogobius chulae TaxID=88201 RepID=A0AAW0N295_9GOBI
MGEATPAQSAAGPFASTLGMGLGSAPVSAARGSAVPQLHNAIVERLRARIELCRRHHSTCENRYQRVQAESTDREHENTLHLLNIVHQGPGNRKTKGSRASHQPPPDYSRATGEQKGSEGEQKVSTRTALGSLRRKIEGHASMQTSKQNGLSCGFSAPDYKRMRLDPSLGQAHCNMNQPMPGSSLSMQRMMPHGVSSDIFNMTLKEMKKEPMENSSCGQSHTDMIFDFKDFKDFKDEGAGNIDPELQDLFDELTKSVPPLNDLEFEKMLKQDDTFGLDLGRPSSAGAAGSLCSPMDRPIKMEHSPDFGQVHSGTPQLRPASAGPSFTLSGTSPNGTSHKINSQVGPPRAMPCWPEISHAEQLKQMAANQQQPGTLLHQPSPGTGMPWASAVSSSSSFTQDKLCSPLGSQRNGPQNKTLNNCLFKSNGHTGSNPPDIKMLNMKPSLHFSPKTGSQSMSMSSTMTKTSPQAQQQRQAPSPNQSQPHSALHFQDHMTGTLCLPNKSSPPLGGGLSFKPSQSRQAGPPCPKLHLNGSLGVMGNLTQPRPPVPNNQQKSPVKNQAMQRPLPPQQQHISTEKDSAHEQFSRHLTRPPPEYKQPRSIVGLHRGNLFTGPPSTTQTSNGPGGDLQSMSCHVTNTSKMSPSPSDDRFGNCLPSSCLNQFQPNNNQSKPHFLGMTSAGNSFGLNNVQHGRPELHTVQGGLMPNVNIGWGSANKQVTSGMRRLPNPNHAQMDMPNLPYQQRHLGPPNQVAPEMGMLRHNSTLRDINSRPNQPIMSQSSLSQASPEQRVPAGAFRETSSGSSSFQSNRGNQLTFDFLPEGDNTVPGINTDSDFIDSLLKSGSGNDDWMKDINLDEILGSHS